MWRLFCMVFFLKVSTGTLYKKEYVEESEWSAYHTVNNVRSLIQCSAVCQRNSNCGLFKHDLDTFACELGSGEAGCFYHKPERLQGPVLALHRDLDILLKHPPSGVQAPTRTSTLEDKSNWVVLASSIFDNTHYAHLAIDDIIHPDNYYHTYASVDAEHPWFRIDLGRTHTVKGFRITTRSNTKERLAFTEVRIGSEHIDGTLESEMFCKNQLCYMTGNNNLDDLSFDCGSPISGRIVTLQKYKHEYPPINLQDRILEFTEIFLVVYCGPLSALDGKCMFGKQYQVDNCAMREQFKGSSTHFADSDEKQGWILDGRVRSGFSFDVLIDGVLTGSYSDFTIFSTPGKSDSDYFSFPWVQIDFTVLKVVKGVHMYSRTDRSVGVHIQFVEVRVGNEDAGAITPDGQRICANALCKITGGGTPLQTQLDDCSGGPILGRYVTIQRYLEWPVLQKPALAMAELDVEFYDY